MKENYANIKIKHLKSVSSFFLFVWFVSGTYISDLNWSWFMYNLLLLCNFFRVFYLLLRQKDTKYIHEKITKKSPEWVWNKSLETFFNFTNQLFLVKFENNHISLEMLNLNILNVTKFEIILHFSLSISVDKIFSENNYCFSCAKLFFNKTMR